jgi:hypothetical protein
MLQIGSVLGEELIEVSFTAQDPETCRMDMDAVTAAHAIHPQAL